MSSCSDCIYSFPIPNRNMANPNPTIWICEKKRQEISPYDLCEDFVRDKTLEESEV